MDYNSSRPPLVIPEYGRHIHQMVEHAVKIEDRDERNWAAKTIIQIMAQLNPAIKEIDNYDQKLWSHLFLISEYKLDVDCPFEIPQEDLRKKRPEPLNYPSQSIRWKHYGKSVELIINALTEMDEGPDKVKMSELMANLMKRNYLNWNRDSVNDQVIFDHLEMLSEGKLKTGENFQLDATNDILAKTKKTNRPQQKKKKGNFRKKKY